MRASFLAAAVAPLHRRASEGDSMTPKREALCQCEPAPPGVPRLYFYRDPHPNGHCRSCGRLLFHIRRSH